MLTMTNIMQNYWILDRDTGFLSPSGIFYKGALIKEGVRKEAEIKVKNGYFGSTDINLNREDRIWVRLNERSLIYKSDMRDILVLLYIIVWYYTLLKSS